MDANRNSRNLLLRKLYSFLSGKTAKGGYIAALDQAIISLGNFSAAIIIGRTATQTEFGIYTIGFLLLHFLRAIQDGLVIQPVNIIGARLDKTTFKPYITSTAFLQLILGIVSCVLAAFAGYILTITGNDTAGPALASFAIPFFAWQSGEFIRRLFYARQYYLPSAIISLLSNASRLSILIYWSNTQIMTGALGMRAIAFGQFLAVAFGLFILPRYWTRVKLNLFETLEQNWKLGKWILGGSIANWGSLEIYPIMVADLISFAAAGVYRAAQTLVAPVHLLLRAMDTYITPWASNRLASQLDDQKRRILSSTYLFISPIIIGYLSLMVILRKPILNFLFAGKYDHFADVVAVFAVYYLLWFSYWPLQALIKAHKITKPIFIANVIAVIVMFTVGFGLIKIWGVYGAVFGQSLNALVVSIILWFYWKHLLQGSDLGTN